MSSCFTKHQIELLVNTRHKYSALFNTRNSNDLCKAWDKVCNELQFEQSKVNIRRKYSALLEAYKRSKRCNKLFEWAYLFDEKIGIDNKEKVVLLEESASDSYKKMKRKKELKPMAEEDQNTKVESEMMNETSVQIMKPQKNISEKAGMQSVLPGHVNNNIKDTIVNEKNESEESTVTNNSNDYYNGLVPRINVDSLSNYERDYNDAISSVSDTYEEEKQKVKEIVENNIQDSTRNEIRSPQSKNNKQNSHYKKYQTNNQGGQKERIKKSKLESDYQSKDERENNTKQLQSNELHFNNLLPEDKEKLKNLYNEINVKNMHKANNSKSDLQRQAKKANWADNSNESKTTSNLLLHPRQHRDANSQQELDYNDPRLYRPKHEELFYFQTRDRDLMQNKQELNINRQIDFRQADLRNLTQNNNHSNFKNFQHPVKNNTRSPDQIYKSYQSETYENATGRQIENNKYGYTSNWKHDKNIFENVNQTHKRVTNTNKEMPSHVKNKSNNITYIEDEKADKLLSSINKLNENISLLIEYKWV